MHRYLHSRARGSLSSLLTTHLSATVLLLCVASCLMACASDDSANGDDPVQESGGSSSTGNGPPAPTTGAPTAPSVPPVVTTPGVSSPTSNPPAPGGTDPMPSAPGSVEPTPSTTLPEQPAGNEGGSAGAGGGTPEDPGNGGGGTGATAPTGSGGNAGTDPMGEGGSGAAPVPTMDWLTSWGTSIQSMEPSNMPPPLGDKTLRQYVWLTFSGDTIRLELSNEKGSAPVEVTKVHIAKAGQMAGSIDTGSDAEFTFGGTADVTIPAGEAVWSDPLDYPVVELDRMAITMHFSSVPAEITGHPGARNTSYIGDGDVVSDGAVGGDTRDRWYFINTIDVMAPADTYTVALLGDSITDGYGIMNTFERWPDFLTLAIKEDSEVADKLSVLNLGMGANSLLTPTDHMDAGIDRFRRDVLGVPKIKWLIVLMGVNDIGEQTDLGLADQVTAAYQQIVEESHAEGILVYGSPITPFKGHSYQGGQALTIRNNINDWVINEGTFDELIRLDEAVADPGDPEQLLQRFSNDLLHPNALGYEAMGYAVDTSLFHTMLP